VPCALGDIMDSVPMTAGGGKVLLCDDIWPIVREWERSVG
jgi:hypothetical protein